MKKPVPVDEWSDEEDEAEEEEDDEEEDEDEEEETDSDLSEDDSLLHGGLHGSDGQHLHPRSWFVTNAKTSFFLGSLMMGIACLVVGCTALSSLDAYYADVLSGVKLLREYDQWFRLETELHILDTVAPAYSLTNDGVLAAAVQTQLENTISMTDELITLEDTNVSLGFQRTAAEEKALADVEARVAATNTAHTQIQDDRSKRTIVLGLSPSDQYLPSYYVGEGALMSTDGSYTLTHVVRDLGSSQAGLLHSLQRLYHHFNATFDGSGSTSSSSSTSILTSSRDDVAYTSLLLGLYANVSRICFIVTEDLFAIESLTAQTSSAWASLDLGGVGGRPGESDEFLVNETLAWVKHLRTEYENVSSVVGNVSGYSNLTAMLSLEQVELLAVVSAQSIDVLVSQVEDLQKAQVAARAVYYQQREIFWAVSATAQVSDFSDIGLAVSAPLGETSGLLELQRDLEAQRRPIMNQKEMDAMTKAEALLHENKVGQDGVRDIQIATATVLSPVLAYLLFAAVGVSAEVRKSWFPMKFFVVASLSVVIIVTGIMGGVAGKTVSIISYTQDLVATITEVEAKERELVATGEAQKKFSQFLRYPASTVALPLMESSSSSTFTTTTTAFTRTIALLLETAGQAKIVAQFEGDQLIAQSFNMTAGLSTTTTTTTSSSSSSSSGPVSLYSHWNPTTTGYNGATVEKDSSTTAPTAVTAITGANLHADCKALASAVAFLLFTAPYTTLSGVSDTTALTTISNSFFSLVGLADASTVLCAKTNAEGQQLVAELWTNPEAVAPALHLTITTPKHSILYYMSELDTTTGTNLLSDEITAHTALLREITEAASAKVEAQAVPLEQQRIKDYRLICWLTVCTTMLGQLAAFLIGCSLFNYQGYY